MDKFTVVAKKQLFLKIPSDCPGKPHFQWNFDPEESPGMDEWNFLLNFLMRYGDFRLAQNVYSAQTFIYLRKNRLEHGKRVFFRVAQKLPELPPYAQLF